MRSVAQWPKAVSQWCARNNLAKFLFAAGALALAGCAIVDQYSGRATVYNLESEQAHDQGLLLNIVRASMRRPRQFSIVQQIIGIATAEGSANLTVPFGLHVGSTANTGMFTATASGGPQFQVAPLETNEFYAGILQPISAQLVDLYMHSEFPRDLLFNLFIEKIVMRRTDGICLISHLWECEIVFQNYPGTDIQLELFQALVGYLINLGLSTEKLPAAKTKKPSKSKKKGDSSNDSNDDSSDDSSSDDSSDGSSDGSSIAKAESYAFCFAPREPHYQRQVRADSVCGYAQLAAKSNTRTKSDTPPLGRRSKFEEVRISPEFAAKLVGIVAAHPPPLGTPPSESQAHAFEHIGGFAGRGVSLAIYTRSTETLIFYVGEVVRRQLHPDIEKERRKVMIKTGPPFNHFDEDPCLIDDQRKACKPLFVLEENAAPSLSGVSSVVYEGVRYSIPPDAGAGASYDTSAGASYTVLTVLRQLLILNTKAKSLPSTSILTTR